MIDPGTMKGQWLACLLAGMLVAPPTAAWGQQQTPSSTYNPPAKSSTYNYGTAGAAPAAGATTQPAFKAEEIEQIVAPVALYPDSLLSQVLMASTYPVEVVQADRWARQNKELKGDPLAIALEKQPWDPSVKSLVNFPDVLTMMSEKLDWTVKLGDAFIAQQKSVMDTVQRLRAKAQASGNLKTNEQQKVIVETPSATQATTEPAAVTQIIKIEPANPQVIYVPTYNPTVVYGTWPYPAYPPYYYYPPSYNAGAVALSFGVGMAVGAAWGYAWGGCNWGHSDVDIDIDRNTNINTNIDRSKYKGQIDRNRAAGAAAGSGNRATWQHDASHRAGVAYRDQATAQKFGGASSAQAAQARDAYRGRAEAGRQDITRGGADSFRSTGAGGTSSVGNRDISRPSGGTGSAGGTGQLRSVTPSNRPANTGTTGTRSSAFNGAGSSGSSARTSSQRGQVSRSSSPARSAPARSAPSRGGGGGRRR